MEPSIANELQTKIQAFHMLANVFQALAGIAVVPVVIYGYKAYKSIHFFNVNKGR
jgi:hypothetical protein